jgi:hypothetical protein
MRSGHLTSRIARRAIAPRFFIPLLLNALVVVLRGQELPAPPPAGAETRTGLTLNGLSFSTTYAVVSPGQTSGPFNSSLATLGGAASLGWTVSREHSSSSLTYSPSYSANLNDSSLGGMNHAFTFSASRSLTARWNSTTSVAASVNSFDQFLFSPSRFGQIVSTPATFDQLAAAILTGTSSNVPLNNLLHDVSALDSPAAPALYGNRTFGVSASTGISYSPTARLTIAWQIGASRTQALQSGSDSSAVIAGAHNANTLGRSSLSVAYSLSPRTSVAISGGIARNLSDVSPQAYTGTLTATVSRTMSRRWFLTAGFGGGYISGSLQAGPGTPGPQYSYTGGIGFKTYSQTFMANYSRELVNSNLALSGGAFNAGTAAWTYSRPGALWWLRASYTYEQQTYPGIPEFSSWHALGAFGRTLVPRVSIQGEYALGSLATGPYITSLINHGGLYNAVRISLIWVPNIKLFYI